MASDFKVSVILPMRNAAEWLPECLKGLLDQSYQDPFEISIFDDNSTDNSLHLVESFREQFAARQITLKVTQIKGGGPLGCGFAKNSAIKASSGEYLCFQDADDISHPNRIELQLQAAMGIPNVLVGSRFFRIPEDSTRRYTSWANRLTPQQLYTQIYTANGPTLIMPTWFCHRSLLQCGGFDETPGVPEDLILFYRHLNRGGSLKRVDEVLVTYRYHSQATTHSIQQETIWFHRLNRFSSCVLSEWNSFTIWNAGKQGRRFYRSLDAKLQKKVVAFCDVDSKKIANGFYIYEESSEVPKPRVPILHFRDASPPFVICVKLDLTGGEFEKNLQSLHLIEGKDYYLFS
ncbi:unnamed protein product [Darwinula stevensoni]|uniref:Glycosyltransferase 2-like domain-containing protein n=1 Tax=Darwinula stevensoni TaxID=69355 RepID=A0A7R8X4L2_9CRUS|nr:unnamed protein product [Darwinula stevensoni]CAG0885265.1 unnamed protein product [Darwinula stevensoni]